MNDVRKAIGNNDKRITYFAGDMSEEKTCSSLMEYAMNMFGRIGVLVNNAGVRGAQKSVEELTSSERDYVIVVNLKEAFLFARELVKRMTQHGNGSRAITTLQSSISHQCTNPSTTAVSALCCLKRRNGNADKDSSTEAGR